jgi:autotransporter-associated beta strand protein
VGLLTGGGTLLLGANQLSIGSANLDGGFGSISGVGGSIVKEGTGTFILSCGCTYTGGTTVNAGTLVMRGSTASAVTVNGGTLGGSGTVGSIVVNAGGRVAPGVQTAFQTLNVTGNVSFASGASFFVNLNPSGARDQIAASGALTLSGGNVTASVAGGSASPGSRFVVITANGGVSGTFSTLTTNVASAFAQASLVYDPTDVAIAFSRNSVSFPDVAATPNQRAVAGALQSLGAGPLFAAILPLSGVQARAAFDNLSGEVHASTQSVTLGDARFLRDAVLGRLRQSSFAGAGPMAPLGSGGPAFASGDAANVAAGPFGEMRALAFANDRPASLPV